MDDVDDDFLDVVGPSDERIVRALPGQLAQIVRTADRGLAAGQGGVPADGEDTVQIH